MKTFTLLLSLCFAVSVIAEENALRVLSIDSSITETIYALGAEDTLVGVDTTSRYPEAASALPSVGYMRALSAEGILSLNPNLVIASADAGPRQVLEQLKQAGLRVEIIDSTYTLDGVLGKVKRVARLLDRTAKGEALIGDIQRQAQTVRDAIAQSAQNTTPRVMFLLAAGGHGVSLAGKDTQAQALIELMGGENVASEFTSYKPLSQEGALKAQADVIVIAETREGPNPLEKYPALKLTPAFEQNRVIQADSMLLLGFGPRLPDAMSTLFASFYPQAEQPFALHHTIQ